VRPEPNVVVRYTMYITEFKILSPYLIHADCLIHNDPYHIVINQSYSSFFIR